MKEKKNEITLGSKRKKSKKRKIIALLIIVGGVLSILFSAIYFSGILNPIDDKEFTWDVQKGDVFYYNITDNYYDISDDKLRKSFNHYLKSEILEVKDLPTDFDNDSDLVIMSSLLYGDKINNIEFPNYFDLYHIFIDMINEYKIVGSFFDEENVTALTEWSVPSAIHLQMSSFYHYLTDIINAYNSGSLMVNITGIPTLDSFFNWISLNINFIDDFREDFEDDIIDQEPLNLSYSIPTDNQIKVVQDYKDSENQMVNLTQNNPNPTTSTISKDLLEYFGKKNEDLDIGKYWFKSEKVSVELEMNDINDMKQEFQLLMKSDNFDMNGSVGGEIKTFKGFNGVNIRIKKGFLQYKVGDYIYSGGEMRKSFSSEKGWHNFSILGNLSLYFGEKGYKEDRFKIVIKTDKSNPYLFDLEIHRVENSGVPFHFFNVPLYYDCPYDFLKNDCVDQNGEYKIFRRNDFNQVKFNISKENETGLITSIDNIEVKGDLYYYLYSDINVMKDMFLSQLYILSIYHTLFYPNEFNVGSIMALCNFLNVIVKKITGYDEFISFSNKDKFMEIKISYESIRNLRNSFYEYFLNFFQIELSGFLEGSVDMKIELRIDKRIDCLNESNVFFKYNDIGIYRKIGMSLVGGFNSSGEPKNETMYNFNPEDYIKSEMMGIIRIESFYTSLIIGVISSISVFSVFKLIQYVIKKRKERII